MKCHPSASSRSPRGRLPWFGDEVDRICYPIEKEHDQFLDLICYSGRETREERAVALQLFGNEGSRGWQWKVDAIPGALHVAKRDVQTVSSVLHYRRGERVGLLLVSWGGTILAGWGCWMVGTADEMVKDA